MINDESSECQRRTADDVVEAQLSRETMNTHAFREGNDRAGMYSPAAQSTARITVPTRISSSGVVPGMISGEPVQEGTESNGIVNVVR